MSDKNWVDAITAFFDLLKSIPTIMWVMGLLAILLTTGVVHSHDITVWLKELHINLSLKGLIAP